MFLIDILTEEFDFPDNSLGINQVFKGFGHLLNGDLLLGLVVVGGAHHTVSTMPDLLYVLEFVFNHECCT